MPFTKGHKLATGRKKGIENKSTLEFKEAVNNLISYATPHMVDWLEEIAKSDKNKALEHIYKFAQFGYPLLARTESQFLDKEGKPANASVIVKYIGSDTDSESV